MFTFLLNLYLLDFTVEYILLNLHKFECVILGYLLNVIWVVLATFVRILDSLLIETQPCNLRFFILFLFEILKPESHACWHVVYNWATSQAPLFGFRLAQNIIEIQCNLWYIYLRWNDKIQVIAYPFIQIFFFSLSWMYAHSCSSCFQVMLFSLTLLHCRTLDLVPLNVVLFMLSHRIYTVLSTFP
jgi:hypothetical protein